MDAADIEADKEVFDFVQQDIDRNAPGSQQEEQGYQGQNRF